MLSTKERKELIEELREEVEKITQGERFINTLQLEELEELESVWVEDCGASGTGRGTLISLLYIENDVKTDIELAECVVCYDREE